LHLVHRGLKCGPRAELVHELDWRSHLSERGDAQHFRVTQIDHALVLVLVQQGLQHGARDFAILRKVTVLANLIRPLSPRQRPLVVRDVKDQVERIEVLANFSSEVVENDAVLFELFDNSTLSVGWSCLERSACRFARPLLSSLVPRSLR
jgi:hypothetical protein